MAIHLEQIQAQDVNLSRHAVLECNKHLPYSPRPNAVTNV
jgi:hypothetical protein